MSGLYGLDFENYKSCMRLNLIGYNTYTEKKGWNMLYVDQICHSIKTYLNYIIVKYNIKYNMHEYYRFCK